MRKILFGVGMKMLNSELILWLLEMYVFPAMRRFVERTNNKYDDKALKHLEGFLREMADEYDVIVKEKK